ncbi:hypothetical protein HDU67_008677, partial [Dinochytrium kinnereticum]
KTTPTPILPTPAPPRPIANPRKAGVGRANMFLPRVNNPLPRSASLLKTSKPCKVKMLTSEEMVLLKGARPRSVGSSWKGKGKAARPMPYSRAGKKGV